MYDSDIPSLLSRMSDQQIWDQHLQHFQPQPISLGNTSQIAQTPSLLARMTSPDSLQKLPLNRAQRAIKKCSSTVIPLSRNIERGRSRKRLYTSTSNQNLRERLEMTGRDLMLRLGHSSRLSKVMTQTLEELETEDLEPSTRFGAPPALLDRIQTGTSQMGSLPPRRSKSMSQSMHGLPAGKINVPCCETVCRRHSSSSNPTLSILKPPRDHSSMNQTVPNSPTRNGRTSSLGEPSILMPFSVDNCQQPRMIPKLKNSAILRSPSEPLNPLRWSRTGETGLLPGNKPLEPQCSHFPTEFTNSQATENTSSISFLSLIPASTAESLPLTKQSKREWKMSETLNSPISRSSPISRLRIWIQSGYRSSPELRKTKVIKKGSEGKTGRKTNLATNRMMGSATKWKRIAGDDTSATNVEREDTRERSVERPDFTPKRPKYLDHSVWTDVQDSPMVSPTACCTMTDDSLPRPPAEEYDNHGAVSTIANYPHLFRIVTPIKVDRFEYLLSSHPNKTFVQSVCTSLREGFWPWAKTQKDEYPITWDFSDRPPKTEREADFLRSQRDVELSQDRYSEGFSTDLLPGMYSTPIHAVPKLRSEKLRLVNDHSAGTYSLNSMIAREDVVGAKMDTISDLIAALLRYRRENPKTTLILFKSDVFAAYRRLPLHPLWQIKQIVTIDNIRHVDRCTSFGGRGSCRDYTAFMGLVLWIAIFVKLLVDLFGYIDDNFSFEREGNVLWYEPYQCYYPAKQTELLKLWDEIGLPHDKSKQEYAPVLRIIGFMVDPQRMRVSMDTTDQDKLIQHVSNFSATVGRS